MPRKSLPLGLALILAALVLALPAGAQAAGRSLRVVLPLRAHTAALARFASAVSTPGNPRYHHYRSIAWLSAHYGAGASAERNVAGYLRAHGARRVRIDATGLFVDATLTRRRAQQLFATPLVRRGSRAQAHLAPGGRVRVPAVLRGQVTGVVGLDTAALATGALARRSSAGAGSGSGAGATTSPAPPASPPSITSPPSIRSATVQDAFRSLTSPIARTDVDMGSGYFAPGGTPTGCAAAQSVQGFTPNQYMTAYGYDPVHGSDVLGQGERVALIEVDGFKRADISTFAKCFNLHVPKIVAFATDNSVSNKGLAPGGEATLDLEVLTAAAPNLSEIDVYESSARIASALQAITAPLQNSGYKPEVISASLGLCEPQIRQAIGLAGIANTEAALEEASASGITVLAASGDDGSADCVNAESEEALPLAKLAVNFPASSPYVTAVGGTNVTLNPDNTLASQQVWNDDASSPGSAGGGGFSTVFKRPSYQSALPGVTDRALPDVSMLADIAPGFDVYCSARPACVSDLPGMHSPWQSVGGTSAATPLLAGGLALVDEELREHEQQSLGLVNPLLYALGANPAQAPLVYSDVSIGSNDVGPFIRRSGQTLGCCSANPGFDAASGWGSVNLANFAAAALAATPALVDITQVLNPRQSPVRAKGIYVRASCSGRCQLSASATVSIAGLPSQTYRSGLSHLNQTGTRTLKIPLPTVELVRLRAALAQQRQVSASVVSAIVDPAGNVERQTPAQSLTITQ